MKQVSWSKMRLMTLGEILEGECLRVTADGEMAVYLVIKPEGEMQYRIEGICAQIDASRMGKGRGEVLVPTSLAELKANLDAGNVAGDDRELAAYRADLDAQIAAEAEAKGQSVLAERL